MRNLDAERGAGDAEPPSLPQATAENAPERRVRESSKLPTDERIAIAPIYISAIIF